MSWNESNKIGEIIEILHEDMLVEAKMKITKKKHLVLTFDGYYLNLSSIPSQPGVYCIYSAGRKIDETYTEHGEFLYIGEAVDMNDRLTCDHKTLEKITKDLKKKDSKPCFSFAKTEQHELAETALIFRTKPPYNDKSTEGYHREPIVIDVKGKHHGIAPKITIDENEIT